jgi:hypothetical protein
MSPFLRLSFLSAIAGYACSGTGLLNSRLLPFDSFDWTASAAWHAVSLLWYLARNRAPDARNKAGNPELLLVRKYRVFVWLRLEAASDRKNVRII